MAKPTHIRIPPEAVSAYPAYIPFNKIYDKFILDFSGTVDIDATGLNFLLCRLLNQISLIGQDVSYDLIIPQNPVALEILEKSNFEFLLRNFLYNSNVNLSSPLLCCDLILNENKPIEYHWSGGKKYSYPIYIVDFSAGENRRNIIDEFEDYIDSILSVNTIGINKIQLRMILKEIVKNSADHGEGNGYFGIDLLESIDNSIVQINFSFGDMGSGIKAEVSKWFKKNHSFKEDRFKHMSLGDTYQAALQKGFTTKAENGVNLGMGMSLIMDGSKGMNLHLSTFDAESRCVISKMEENMSHSKVRSNIYSTGNKLGFCWMGTLSL